MPKMNKEGWLLKENRCELVCKQCGETKPLSEFSTEGKTSAGNKKYKSRCRQCYSKHAAKSHKTMQHMQTLAEMRDSAKTKCVVCGYDRCKAALDFHHIDPSSKAFEISDAFDYRRVKSITVDDLVSEIEKCAVVCCRCHREIHAGLIQL